MKCIYIEGTSFILPDEMIELDFHCLISELVNGFSFSLLNFKIG